MLKQTKLLKIIIVVVVVCLVNVFWFKINSSSIDHNAYLKYELSLIKRSNHIIKYYNNKHNNDNAYATFMTSSSFFPAFQVFLYSFNKNVLSSSSIALSSSSSSSKSARSSTSSSSSLMNSNTIIICICNKDIAMINATKYELAKYPNINYEIHILPRLQRVGNEKDRWAINWSKLFFWSLIDYKVIFYIDLDVLFLRNVNDVFSISFDKFLGTSDSGRYNPPTTKKINGGVFLMHPSLDTLRSLLITRRLNISQYESEQVEQGLINYYFKSKCCLSLDYNMQKTTQRYWEPYWNYDTIKILHFVGEKPWNSWAHPLLRDSFISRKLKFVGKLRQADSWDADIYQETHNLWKLYYFQARRRTFDKLSLCIGHYGPRAHINVSDDHYTSLLKYIYIQLDGPINVKSDFVMQLLKNEKVRVQLGPIATLFVASELIDSEYMAITNIWTEEDSVDWTKVDLKENKLFFWDGQYANNYYESQELNFPGIIKVMTEIVGNLPELPSGYFMKGNIIICSKQNIQNLSRDMINMLRSFLRRYTGTCPFQNAADNCIQIFAEVYINIWIKMANIDSVYAVDISVLSSQSNAGDEVYLDNNEYFAY